MIIIIREFKIIREKSNSGLDGIDRIGRIWNEHPELRLYQIIMLITDTPNIEFMTDEEILKKAQRIKVKTI